MVMALNKAGLRVVQDMVFNHTAAGGEADNSVLDKVVPGYYHRFGVKGDIEHSTCCSNTATEDRMMRRLMLDALAARDRTVQGGRLPLQPDGPPSVGVRTCRPPAPR